MTSQYRAFVYSSPGCMRCEVTAHALNNMGVNATVRQLEDYPFKRELMNNLGWTQLPLVELIAPDGEVKRWSGMSHDNLKATKKLIKESA